MDEPTVLRTTKIGGGFVKEDVMTYLDELNSKIVTLEEELKNAKETGPTDPQEVIKYRNQVENLQEKLNTSNNALRAAKKENEELQKTIQQLKASGAGGAQAGAQNAATVAALEAAKKEIETLKNQLKAAEQKAAAGAASPQANAQTAAALEAAKKEIDTLRNQLKAAEQKAASAGAAAAASTGNAAAEAELAKTKQELSRISAELAAKTKEITDITGKLEAKTREVTEKDNKIAQLTKEGADAVAAKDAEIEKLNSEITDLRENGTAPAFDMGALFTEAQKNVNQITNQAKRDADAVTKEANQKAEQILKDANAEAEKTIANANATAETCINEANAKAKTTIDEANSHADKVNEMSSTVRDMLLNEIESVNAKLGDINSVLSRLTTQATDRMGEAQLIIGEARKAVDSKSDSAKKAEAPKINFEPTKAPKAELSDLASAKVDSIKNDPANSSDPFANVGNFNNHGFNNNNNNNNNNNGYNNNSYNNNKPATPPAGAQTGAQNANQNKPNGKSANFNFDMAELLKAAEEEAAKEE